MLGASKRIQDHVADADKGERGRERGQDHVAHKLSKKTLVALAMVLTLTLASVLITEADEAETYLPQTQVDLCETYGDAYAICPEILEAIIEAESSGHMNAKNGTCYGIAQINGAVWGYYYTTEELQIAKMCELLSIYLREVPDMAYALDRYNGNSNAWSNYENGTISTYASKVLERAETLERVHGK